MASESRVFPCNTCNLKFESSELQRSHMRQPWHIHNLRRRVAELPALSEREYLTQSTTGQVPTIRLDNSDSDSDKQHKKRPSPEPQSSSDSIPGETTETEGESSKTVPPTQCLFCNTVSPTLDANVEHMFSTHGLFIPSQDQLSDMQSFLGYLATLVFEYHQCLYCGLERGTADGVQTHMRDKGHCMINLTPESELLEFWELSGSESEDEDAELPQSTKGEAVRLSETEWRLPSGAVINSRSDATLLRAKPGLAQTRAKGPQQRSKRDELKAIAASAEEDSQEADEKPSRGGGGSDRRVAVRGDMGLVGVSEDQRRALQVTEKKMKRREAIAKSAYRHAMEMQPRKTIYYKTENPVYQAG
ncbi:hypothetical protein BU24DRAFT_487181 [Aaosphaeria arxii CBS 175.79]|uniref:C2H2-type domain-containing protein n=1 Tax=Aaosphaeria arxii CBS 175.79 TaxID=1450172 RepID=A0A6A5Y5M9_9PLEO|nr:uncharacterized protein BU24DRAFT_487181 [Aaosphaeria arxii CBS 175.79]KAF2020596.1 hypothetical protein BU24DRAFT_487181 [Aaosphaeria arxii CBS 175.79]